MGPSGKTEREAESKALKPSIFGSGSLNEGARDSLLGSSRFE